MEAPEKTIQAQIINLLKYNGFYVQRMNAGGMRSSYTLKRGFNKGATKSYLVRAAALGTPDIMAFKVIDGVTRLFFIEVKRPGKEPTFLQKMKMEELKTYGAECFVATSTEDVHLHIKNLV